MKKSFSDKAGTTETCPEGAPTAAHVAALAGVSPITVSRVLSGKVIVADSTRKRVEAAVLSLNYVPNTAAQILAAKRRS